MENLVKVVSEHQFKCTGGEGNESWLIYRPHTSELLWRDTGEKVSLERVGLEYESNCAREWPVAPTVSPTTPLGKKRPIRALKIQLGLKCNGSCKYCNQTARPAESHGNLKDAKAFLEWLPNWLEPAGADVQGKDLRIEFWGGEPFLYWKTMRYLGDMLHERYPNAAFNIVTNGRVLDEEKIAWLDRHNVAVAVSHDGPAHRDNRLYDPFDTPATAEHLRKLFYRLSPKGLISFNCVLANNNPSLAAIREYIAAHLGCRAENVPLSTEEIVLPYEAGGQSLSPAGPEEHHRMFEQFYRELITGKALPVLNVKEKLEDFFHSLAQGRPSHALGQRCGMDREDTIAVDLKGNVLTCQNAAAGDGHRIGTTEDFNAIRLNTAWHWSKRNECPSCPVLQLCKGSCLRLEGELWQTACNTSRTYNMAVFAAGIFFLTGERLEVERPLLPQ